MNKTVPHHSAPFSRALFTIPLALLVLVTLFLSRACAAVVTFESGSDLTNYFNGVGTAKYSEASGTGLSGSSGLVTDSNSTNGSLVTISGILAGATTPTFTLSLYFKFTTPTSTAGGNPLIIGLVGSPATDPYALAATVNYYGIHKDPFASTYVAVHGSLQGLSGGFEAGPIVSLQDGNWYRLSMNGAWNSTNSKYDLQYLLQNSNSDGQLGSTLNSYISSGVNSMAISNTIYGLIGTSGPAAQMGIAAMDNFAFDPVSTPEPSTAILLCCGVVACLSRRVHGRHSRSPVQP